MIFKHIQTSQSTRSSISPYFRKGVWSSMRAWKRYWKMRWLRQNRRNLRQGQSVGISTSPCGVDAPSKLNRKNSWTPSEWLIRGWRHGPNRTEVAASNALTVGTCRTKGSNRASRNLDFLAQQSLKKHGSQKMRALQLRRCTLTLCINRIMMRWVSALFQLCFSFEFVLIYSAWP